LNNAITGLPNASRLKFHLYEEIEARKDFNLLTFRVINFDDVNRYLDYSVGERALLSITEKMEEYFGGEQIYSIFTHEFAVILTETDIEAARKKARGFLDFYEEPVLIDGLPVDLAIKCGITNYPLHGDNANDLFKKSGRTLDQQKFNNQQISIYDHTISEKNKAKYQTLISLYDAIRNDEFSLVYQPIVDIRKNRIKSAEALLRWENSGGMNPAEFVKIAEDAAIISEITKWVIRNVIKQLKAWEGMGLSIKIAVNISSKDLNDESVIDYTTRCLAENQVQPENLEFELTERVIIENESKVETLLSKIKKNGMKSSLDDFGTGYNSLMQLVKLPIDYLKIDKYFTDNITDERHYALISELVVLAHKLGKEVIAEGVETKEQLEALHHMGCDNIQGYFFSKPVAPDMFFKYHRNFS